VDVIVGQRFHRKEAPREEYISSRYAMTVANWCIRVADKMQEERQIHKKSSLKDCPQKIRGGHRKDMLASNLQSRTALHWDIHIMMYSTQITKVGRLYQSLRSVCLHHYYRYPGSTLSIPPRRSITFLYTTASTSSHTADTSTDTRGNIIRLVTTMVLVAAAPSLDTLSQNITGITERRMSGSDARYYGFVAGKR